MDEEHFSSAIEELKRADHLIFVSLKYTRTCDIIKHIIERLVSCADFMFDHLLSAAREQGKIQTIPTAPTAKAEEIKKLHKDDPKIQDFVEFYLFLKKITRSKFTRRQEYRRHVTMVCVVENNVIEINIDKIEEYFNKTKEFVDYVKEMNIVHEK